MMAPTAPSRGERLLYWVETGTALLAALLLAGATIAPLRSLLEHVLVLDAEGAFGVVALALFALWLANERQRAELRRAVVRLEAGDRLLAGPEEVRTELLQRAKDIHPKQRSLLVLGTTLDHTCTTLQTQLPKLAGWSFELLHLDPEFIRQHPEWFDPNWASTVTAMVASLRAAATGGVTLRFVPYRLLPVVHGLRLGSGDLFVSVSRWRPRGGALGSTLLEPDHPFELVEAADLSPRAQAYRDLFENWYARARGTVPATGGGSAASVPPAPAPG